MERKMYVWKTLGAFLIVLLLMQLGHALMILMEHILSESVLHYSAFAMELAALCIIFFGYKDIKQSFINLQWKR